MTHEQNIAQYGLCLHIDKSANMNFGGAIRGVTNVIWHTRTSEGDSRPPWGFAEHVGNAYRLVSALSCVITLVLREDGRCFG